MTTETAAEMLYDEYTGTTGRFHTSTQKDRWLAFTAKVIAAAQPAPAGVIDREKLDRKIKKLERKLERVTEDIRRHAGRNLPFELEREDKR